MSSLKHRRSFTRIGLSSVAAAAALAAGESALAVDYFWDLAPPAEGAWSDDVNWAGDVEPGTQDTAFINNGGTAVVSDGQSVETGFAVMGGTAGTSGTLKVTGGYLRTNFDVRIGGNSLTVAGGTGHMEQSGGEVYMNGGNFNVGIGPGSVATYDLSGGLLQVRTGTAGFIVGNRTTGTMNQTGGDVFVRNPVAFAQVGRNTATVAAGGTYDLSGGSLTAPSFFFGQTNGPAGNNTLNLSGTGALVTQTVAVRNANATNTFNFTGGTLTANSVEMPLTNNGGNLSPATVFYNPNAAPGSAAEVITSQVGTTTFTGANPYTQSSSGRTTVDITSTGHDVVAVGGAAALAGNLTVRSEEGFTPPSAVDNLAQYQVMTFESRSGTRFTSYTGRDVNAHLTYVPVYSETDLKLVATEPGDATLDGRVNLADFGRLRAGFGQAAAAGDFTQGDFNLDGTVNLADFGILRAHFNHTVNSGAFAPAAISEADWAVLSAFEASVVPEPTAAALLALAAPALLARRRRRGA